jgi:hypothetical protein
MNLLLISFLEILLYFLEKSNVLLSFSYTIVIKGYCEEKF